MHFVSGDFLITIVRYGIYKKGVKILGLFCEPTKDLPHECSNTARAAPSQSKYCEKCPE